MKRRQKAEIVGFIVTPSEIANRIAALDKSIQALAADVKVTPTRGALDGGWKIEWDSFLRRWAVERDSYATWDARLFATRVMPRLQAFEDSYRFWAKDYQRKAGVAPTVPTARPSEDLTAALVPTEAWWLLAGLGALWLLGNTKILR